MRRQLKIEQDTEVVDIEMNPPEGPASYAALFEGGDCKLTRFEPPLIPDEFPKARKNERFLPVLVADGKDQVLKVCAHPGLSSLLEPNPKVLALYPDLARNAAVTRRVPDLPSKQLDEVGAVKVMDLLKLSMAGMELAVLRGAAQALRRCVAVQVSVAFVQIYKGQALAGDVDVELRKRGFVLHHYPTAKSFAMAAGVGSYANTGASKQLITAEALYLRDFSKHELMDDEQLKHLAVICHHYQCFDEARFCMGLLEKRRAVPKETVLRYMGL